MIKVYFQDDRFSELVAVFKEEQLYMACLPTLEARAKELGMIVTEVVIEAELLD